MFQADPTVWGEKIKTYVKAIIGILLVIGLILWDTAQFCYQAGYATGQFIHRLNDDVTTFMSKDILSTMMGYSPSPLTAQQEQVNPWQLKLQHLFKNNSWIQTSAVSIVNFLGDTSKPTESMSSTKEKNQLSSISTPAINGTADQRKEAGTTPKAGPKQTSVSSPRSKPSGMQSTSTSKPKKSTASGSMNSDGQAGKSPSAEAMASTTRRTGRSTSKKKTEAVAA